MKSLVLSTLVLAAAVTDASAKLPSCRGPKASMLVPERVDAHTLRLCWVSPDACFTLDVNAKAIAWTPVAKPKDTDAISHAPPLPGITVGLTVSLCDDKGKDCRDYVTPPDAATSSSQVFAIANADRSRIAAITEKELTLFDGKSTKLATIARWKPDSGAMWYFDNVFFFGDRIYVEMSSGQDTEIRVFDGKGKQVADLGATAMGAFPLADGSVAVVTSKGEALDIRDKTGAKSKRVEVFGASSKLRASNVLAAADGQIAIGLEDGSVTLVDPTNGTRTVVTAPPICP